MSFLIQLLMAPIIVRLSARRSHDYLDAGSGSMILQILLGGTAGVAVMARMFWRHLGNIFHIGHRADDEITVADE